MEVRKDSFPRIKSDKSLYNANHPKAIRAILPWLKTNGYDLNINPLKGIADNN